jgi:hypothetical protein
MQVACEVTDKSRQARSYKIIFGNAYTPTPSLLAELASRTSSLRQAVRVEMVRWPIRAHKLMQSTTLACMQHSLSITPAVQRIRHPTGMPEPMAPFARCVTVWQPCRYDLRQGASGLPSGKTPQGSCSAVAPHKVAAVCSVSPARPWDTAMHLVRGVGVSAAARHRAAKHTSFPAQQWVTPGATALSHRTESADRAPVGAGSRMLPWALSAVLGLALGSTTQVTHASAEEGSGKGPAGVPAPAATVAAATAPLLPGSQGAVPVSETALHPLDSLEPITNEHTAAMTLARNAALDYYAAGR